MRVRFERYEKANRSVQIRSLLAFLFGGMGVVFFGFLGFMGILMFFMPEGQGGGLWERRAGIFLGIFMGLIPGGISALVIAWGAKQRGRFRRLGELAAISRQAPMLTTAQVAHALRLSPADAEGLVIEAGSLGLIDDSPHPDMATAPPPAPPAPLAPPAVVVAHVHASAHAPTVSAEAGGHVASAPPPTPGSGRAAGTIGPGAVLGGVFRIEEPLGRGGMGAVHAARHLRTGRRYAVKTVLAGVNASEDALRRFEREATAASALGHPGIVQVHDFNVEPDGLFYLVMDLLEGETLERRLEKISPLPWLDAQRIAVELCAALCSIATTSRATSTSRVPRARPEAASAPCSSTSGS
jgi:serine/threonine-protein kinase